MDNFKELNVVDFTEAPFKLIGSDWMLITAKNKDSVNTMTASWGGLGVLWGKNVAYIVIRPQRYTKEFVDYSNSFSLSFFDNKYKDKLAYLGRVSGRDEDKISKAGLTIALESDIPYFEESNLVMFCKNLYAQNLEPRCFIEKSCDEKWYPNKDYHTMYIAEIEKICQRG